MVPQSMSYYRPDSAKEAHDLYIQLRSTHRKPTYYGGGTEILTRMRLNDAQFDAVIDLKQIEELTAQEETQGRLRFGAATRLTAIADQDLWPLLTASSDRIADHTTRGQITLGGNVLSTLPYREALLPFLLMDSAEVDLYTHNGRASRPLTELFDDSWHLAPDDLLISLSVDAYEARGRGFKSYKMTRQDWIDYPLVTVSATRQRDGSVRAAFSGWAQFPFSSARINRVLSDTRLSPRQRAEQAVKAMPVSALDDIHGSGEYRAFVTTYTLENILREWEDNQ